MPEKHKEFKALNICVLTVSDTRTIDTDSSGEALISQLKNQGHQLIARQIVKDDIYKIRACTCVWIADNKVNVILITGGTGFSGRDSTPEALQPLFDKQVPGFGELFRHYSLSDIGTSTIQSRALAGFSNYTLIACLPGSTGACELAWDKILKPQLDCRTRPCNFYNHLQQKK